MKAVRARSWEGRGWRLTFTEGPLGARHSPQITSLAIATLENKILLSSLPFYRQGNLTLREVNLLS